MVVLPELIKKLEIKSKIILVGHSDGGSIALIYASLAPNNLSGIIVEAPHIFVDDYSRNGVKNTVDEFETNTLKRGLRRYHGDNVDSMFYGWSDIWLSEKLRDGILRKCCRELKLQLLVIQGDKDEYGTLAQVEAIERALKGKMNVSIIKNCGHSPHSEYKNEVLELMRNFILNLKFVY